MLPYVIQFRLKTLVYFTIVLLLIYLWWYYVFQLQESRLLNSSRSYHSLSHVVNFKHLLIACILAAEKGGIEVKKARQQNDLGVNVKGKTREGVVDVLTDGDKNSNVAMVNSLLYSFPGIRIISEENFQNVDVIDLLRVEKYLKHDEYATIPDDIHLNLDELVIWIDPLDATKEYSEGLTEYVTTMVCVVRNGQPLIGVIHQPFVSQTYWATKFGIDRKLLTKKFTPDAPLKSAEKLRIIISRSHKGDVEHWMENNPHLSNVTLIEAAGSGYKTLQLLTGNADIYLHKTFIKKWDICAPDAILKYATDGTMLTLKGEKINYSFGSDVMNKDGLFATANPNLVSMLDLIQKN